MSKRYAVEVRLHYGPYEDYDSAVDDVHKVADELEASTDFLSAPWYKADVVELSPFDGKTVVSDGDSRSGGLDVGTPE